MQDFVGIKGIFSGINPLFLKKVMSFFLLRKQIPYPSFPRCWRDFKLLYNLYKIFKKSKPDILLNYTIKPVIYCSFLQIFFDFKVINTITGLGTLYLKNKLLKKIFINLYYFSQKKVNKIIFQNIDDKKLFNDLKISNKKNSIVIPGSGINTEYFDKLTCTISNKYLINNL